MMINSSFLHNESENELQKTQLKALAKIWTESCRSHFYIVILVKKKKKRKETNSGPFCTLEVQMIWRVGSDFQVLTQHGAFQSFEFSYLRHLQT